MYYIKFADEALEKAIATNPAGFETYEEAAEEALSLARSERTRWIIVDKDGKEIEPEIGEEFCGNCGWTGDSADLIDDIYNEGAGHKYCPECELSL